MRKDIKEVIRSFISSEIEKDGIGLFLFLYFTIGCNIGVTGPLYILFMPPRLFDFS
jgi:hypothetical protein